MKSATGLALTLIGLDRGFIRKWYEHLPLAGDRWFRRRLTIRPPVTDPAIVFERRIRGRWLVSVDGGKRFFDRTEPKAEYRHNSDGVRQISYDGVNWANTGDDGK